MPNGSMNLAILFSRERERLRAFRATVAPNRRAAQLRTNPQGKTNATGEILGRGRTSTRGKGNDSNNWRCFAATASGVMR